MVARIIALKCPNCGALVERGQNKCKYCGAGLILSPDGSFFNLRSQSTCPKCGAINEASSWFCVNCQTILTNDIDMVKELQNKMKFEQERTKSKFMPPWMREKLEPDEFIYFVFKLGKDSFYAVTDKRIIKSRGRKKYEESLLSEAVTIGMPQVKSGLFSISSFFEVNTFHGSMIFEFRAEDAQSCGIFHSWVQKAMENYNLRKKDVRALIISLPLE